jgi:hypothetical protein
LKPVADIVTVYIPTGNCGTANVPFLDEVVFDSAPVPLFLTVIVAFATTAPDWSSTEPERVDVGTCARATKLEKVSTSVRVKSLEKPGFINLSSM